MAGYDPNFLDVEVALPEFAPVLEELVLEKPELRDGFYADYVNYTIAMHREHRTALFCALNIDQNKIQSVKRSNDWRIDSRVGNTYQLNNDYYYRNPWDRGHLARRSAAAWGDSSRTAKRASDETFYFTNAALQHSNFNQDEWLALEDWVKALNLDRDGKISVISGPIFGDYARSIQPQGRDRAIIPAAFYKVVFFVNKSNELEVRAFMMLQDKDAMRDKSGRQMFDFQNYQVTVAEIEERTGLIFPDEIPDKNPLLFYENEEKSKELNISHFPERIEVDSEVEIIGKDQSRKIFMDEDVDVFIAAALVNPKGNEREGEWISIINLSNEKVDLKGWTLSDTRRPPLELSGTLEPGQSQTVKPVTPLQLGNNGGVIELYDEARQRIDRVKYTATDAAHEGRPVIFAYREALSQEVKSPEKAAELANAPGR
ncbi:MAG: DNA/RNA non-specific endonuclease [Alphaproteobacteria bacterium]